MDLLEASNDITDQFEDKLDDICDQIGMESSPTPIDASTLQEIETSTRQKET